MLKALLVLEIFTFSSWKSGYVEKWLDKKVMANFKMMSQTGQQIIAINILCNIRRSKDNKTIKFGQLGEYNMRNVFLEKWYTKYDGEASPRPYSKISKLSISLHQQSEMLLSL